MSKKTEDRQLRGGAQPNAVPAWLGSGSKASRAGTDLVPMAFFHASGSPVRPRFGSKPTPIDVLRGGSAIMVVIRAPAS